MLGSGPANGGAFGKYQSCIRGAPGIIISHILGWPAIGRVFAGHRRHNDPVLEHQAFVGEGGEKGGSDHKGVFKGDGSIIIV